MDRNTFKEQDAKRRARIRNYYNMLMGVLWIALGSYALIGTGLNFDATTGTIFGIVCLLYGAFRLYRAFKAKKYL
jgi:uncharacterized membrane protein HdeD (DUF308 family)